MSTPKLYLESTQLNEYIKNTNAKLEIRSVVTSTALVFPAFLTDFSQNFDARWNTEDVFGRMDPIATYQGTKRTMNLSFDLPSGEIKEAKSALSDCAKLVQMVYPVYKSFKIADAKEATTDNPAVAAKFSSPILSKPPLVRIKFANLISGVDSGGLLGWISGLSWKPNLEMGMFASGEELYPKVIGLSFSFNILHEETLNQEQEKWPFPFGGK